MLELTPAHLAVMQRLAASGFAPAVLPLYPNAIVIRRGPFAALLEPQASGDLRLLTPASYMLEGNFTVRLRRESREWFVWKSRQVEATSEILAQLAKFSADLSLMLSAAPPLQSGSHE